MKNIIQKSLNTVKNYSNIFMKKEKQKIILGRWETSGKYINIKATQANFDSCGDKLCGKPKDLCKFINQK